MSDVIKCHMGKVSIIFKLKTFHFWAYVYMNFFSLFCGELNVEVCLIILNTSCVTSAFDSAIQYHISDVSRSFVCVCVCVCVCVGTI
jgi:hypothetical protein